MDRRSRQTAGKRLSRFVFALLIAAMLVAISAHAQTEQWRRDKPCGERHGAMQPANTQGCARSWCSDTALGKLCACVREDSDRTRFTLDQRNWDAPSIPPMGGDPTHFRIDRLGESRLLLAMMTSESVGIAVSTWLVWSIDSGRISKPIEVQNYGTLSFATKPSTGAACLLLAARWHSGWEPRRGHGTYIAGSWYAIENGEFARVEDRPAIYQRYLAGVERARYEAEEKNLPLSWFRSATPAVGPRPVTGKQL